MQNREMDESDITFPDNYSKYWLFLTFPDFTRKCKKRVIFQVVINPVTTNTVFTLFLLPVETYFLVLKQPRGPFTGIGRREANIFGVERREANIFGVERREANIFGVERREANIFGVERRGSTL